MDGYSWKLKINLQSKYFDGPDCGDIIIMMIIDDDQVYKQLSEKNDTIIRNVLDIEASKAS